MEPVGTLAGALSSYGLYGIIAILALAITYLWRQVENLNSQIKSILSDQNKMQLDLNTKLAVALEANTKILEKVEKKLDK